MKSGELFAGVGGLTMAVDRVFNATPSWFCQFEPPTPKQKNPSQAPSKVLAFHWPTVPNYGDVSTVDWATVPRVNVMAGGFPCTDVSLAGRRAGMKDGTRSGLWSEYAQAIEVTRPDWVVIENVAGLFTAETDSEVEPCPWCLGDGPDRYSLRALDAVLGDLATLGFDAEWGTLRASDVGAPHGRLRVFIVAWPRERTAPHTSRGGSRGRAEGQEPSRGDDAALGSDQGGIGGRPDTGLTRSQVFAGDWGDWGKERLLPTPEAKLATSGPDYARMNRDGSGGDDLTTTLWREGMHLLPTPNVAMAEGGQTSRSGDRKGELLLGGIVAQIMPTPRASRGGSTTETMYALGAERVDDERPQGQVVANVTDWGPYTSAIRHAEHIIGRPAPAPVRFGPKVFTHAQLDAHVKSLRSVGGIYELIAQCVEHDNRPHCVGERTEHDQRQARDR